MDKGGGESGDVGRLGESKSMGVRSGATPLSLKAIVRSFQ
jgi:hypothetical protein